MANLSTASPFSNVCKLFFFFFFYECLDGDFVKMFIIFFYIKFCIVCKLFLRNFVKNLFSIILKIIISRRKLQETFKIYTCLVRKKRILE